MLKTLSIVKILDQKHISTSTKYDDDRKCTNCNKSMLYEDDVEGVIVCKNCGVVNGELIIQEKLPKKYDNKQNSEQYAPKSSIYKPIIISYNDILKLKPNQRHKFTRMIRLGNYCDKKERKDLTISEYLSRTVNACKLVFDVYTTAIKLYNMLYKDGVLDNRRSFHVVGALIDMSCRILNKPVRLSTLIKNMNAEFQPKRKIKKGKISKMKLYLVSHIKDETILDKKTVKPLTITEQMIAHLHDFRNEGTFDHEVLIKIENLCTELLKYFTSIKVINENGNGKINYASGIIFLAIRMQKIKISIETMSKWTGVSVSTLRVYLRLLHSYLPEKYQKLIKMKKN